MKIAIVGLGSIGTRHAQNLIDMGEKNVVAFDPARIDCEVYAYKSTGISCLRSTEELWDWNPEAVLICTPPDTHHVLVGDALTHGCHCFVEKPLAANYRHATDLRLYRDETHAKQVLAVGYQLRWQLVEFRTHAIGEGIAFRCAQDMSTWPSHYHKDPLLEFSHEIDAACFINGPVEAVTAQHSHGKWEMRFRHLQGSSLITVYYAGDASPERFAESSNAMRWDFDLARNDQAYKSELVAFIAACRGEGWDDRLCSVAEAAHVVRIIDACRMSAQNCEVVRLA